MREYSSISVSTYDADSLAERLTEKSREGWDVAAIVPTGSSVTAFLSREADAAPNTPTAISDTAGYHSDSAASSGDTSSELGIGGPSASAPLTAEVADVTEVVTNSSGAVEAIVETTEVVASDASPWTSSASESGADATGWAASNATASDAAPVDATVIDSSAATAAGGGAPAGWYADPAGRFELRYWDGAQWTEHVSRQGQQYTDPPVA